MLALAAHLRGAGSFDPDDVRLQFAVLQFFGVDVAEARRWLDEHPAATRDALCFAIFLRETNPARVRVSWPAMMRDRIANRRTNAGEVGYEAWASRCLASGPSAHPFPAPTAVSGPERLTARRPVRDAASDAALATAEPRHENALSRLHDTEGTAGDVPTERPTGSDDAITLWRQIRAATDPGQTLLALSCLDAPAPLQIDGDALVLQDTNGSGEYAIRMLGAQLSDYAASCSDSSVTTVRRMPPRAD